MNSMSEVLICPQGHSSTDRDYCSACGARIMGSHQVEHGNSLASATDTGTGQTCPDCGIAREQTEIAFCEVCGYNFLTGAHGEIGIMPRTTTPEPEAIQTGTDIEPERQPVFMTWAFEISVDPSLRQAGSPECPENVQPYELDLSKTPSLIGRRDASRAIVPEIALDLDEAVSRRHALVQRSEDGTWMLRDIGSANGTRLNGVDLQSLVDQPLHDGDVITLGHWSQIVVKARP